MYNDIIGKIADILEGITAIKLVSEVDLSEFEKYPAAVIIPIGHTETYGSMRDTIREYSFSIRLYVNIQDTEADSQVVLRTIADSVMDALGSQTNISLGGTINFSKLTDGTFRFDSSTRKAYLFEMTYKASVRFNRYA